MNSFYLGIDVGGTYVRFAVYDDFYDSITDVKKVLLHRSGDSKGEVDDNLCKMISTIVMEKKHENKVLKGIGLSLAALFDRESGDVTIWPNNQVWNAFPIREYLTRLYNVPIIMEEDANSGALGEYWAGAGKKSENMAYVAVGTGIGCGLIINKKLYIGTNGWAGEIGHIKVSQEGAWCNCGKRGCLQSIVSGPALLNSFIEMKREKQQLYDNSLNLKEVANLANNGDAEAQEVFTSAGKYIGQMITSIVMMLDISLVVVGGGVMKVGDLLLKPIKNTVALDFKGFDREVRVEKSQLGDNSALVGSINLILSYVNYDKILQI